MHPAEWAACAIKGQPGRKNGLEQIESPQHNSRQLMANGSDLLSEASVGFLTIVLCGELHRLMWLSVEDLGHLGLTPCLPSGTQSGSARNPSAA